VGSVQGQEQALAAHAANVALHLWPQNVRAMCTVRRQVSGGTNAVKTFDAQVGLQADAFSQPRSCHVKCRGMPLSKLGKISSVDVPHCQRGLLSAQISFLPFRLLPCCRPSSQTC
jgi:hypothetical protein